MSQIVTALLLVGVILGAAFLAKRWIRLRREGLLGATLESPSGSPVILYFKTPECVICRVEQEPELRRLSQSADARFELRTIDVAADPDTAERYRVLTSPTTIVLDAEGRVTAVNAGSAPAEILEQQLYTATRSPQRGEQPASGPAA